MQIEWPIHWPVRQKLARPRPPAPSPRVYAAFAIAAIIGVAVFLIWWLTSDERGRRSADAARSAETASAPGQIGPALSKEALIEAALPRGGSLAGWTDAMPLAREQMTGAPLARVNRSTDQVEPWLAESWIASEDHLTYTVKLRPGLTSADGVPLTSAGVIRALGPIAVMGQPVGPPRARSADARDAVRRAVCAGNAVARSLSDTRLWSVRRRRGVGEAFGTACLPPQPELLAQGGRRIAAAVPRRDRACGRSRRSGTAGLRRQRDRGRRFRGAEKSRAERQRCVSSSWGLASTRMRCGFRPPRLRRYGATRLSLQPTIGPG